MYTREKITENREKIQRDNTRAQAKGNSSGLCDIWKQNCIESTGYGRDLNTGELKKTLLPISDQAPVKLLISI